MKISDKLVATDGNIDIRSYDNGFLIEVGGQDKNENWKSTKILVMTEKELLELVSEAINMPRSK